MVTTVAFYLFSLLIVVAAWRVVASPDIVRAALALVIVLAGMAPIYLMLGAEFIATVQVLVYVGAVVVLLLFGIMLTRSPVASGATRAVAKAATAHKLTAGFVSVGLLVVLALVIRSATGGVELTTTDVGRTAAVGDTLLREYVVPFEVISVLLLVTLIGAITLARRD